MAMKFFSNMQDFLHLYNPTPMGGVTNLATSSGSDTNSSNNSYDTSSEIGHNNTNNKNNVSQNSTHHNNSKNDSTNDNNNINNGECFLDARGILRPTSTLSDTEEPSSTSENGNDGGYKKRKSVQFPVDENLVTGFLEPRQPTFLCRRKISSEDANFLNLHEILEAYLNACKKFRVSPSAKIEKQISTFHMVRGERQEILSLRGEKMTHSHMDCIEEIFKRVQFNTVDFEYCFLDDEALISLSDMLEFYDSANRLNLSFNQNVGFRGWQAFFRMLRKSPCLEHLNLRYTSLNERTVPLLARTLRTESSLVSLHLENCSLSGKSMLLLACALKTNTSIRDVYFAENNLNANDAAHIYQIIFANTSIELLDLRNNQLQDAGLAHICDALKNPESQARSKLNTLVLWNNRLTAHGMVHLARALTENKTLKTLNLGSNNVGSEGVSIIKDALARNRTLLRLGLQATKINCQGAIAVAECIADNPILIRVDLRDNPDIKTAGLLALHVALRMNTSILALNLDKSCSHTSSLKSKEHVDHFKKLYDEIHTFCKRNHDMTLEKLKEEELARSKEISPDEDERPKNDDDDDDDNDDQADEGIVEESDDVPTDADVEQCVAKVRKISLTCKESVDNLLERFEAMPRLEEVAEEVNNSKNIEEEKEPSTAAGPSAGPAVSSEVATAVVVPQPLVQLVQKPRPTSLPVALTAAASKQNGPRRFSVSKVSQVAAADKPAPVARRSTVDVVPSEKEEETFVEVRRLVSDMVNYCAYEARELANTPCAPTTQLLAFQELDTPSIAATSTPNTAVEIDNEVEQLVDDLVRFVEYETKGSSSHQKQTSKKSIPTGPTTTDAPVDDYERETEISLAVREAVRDLVKSVSVQLDRKSAGRSSLILRNRGGNAGKVTTNNNRVVKCQQHSVSGSDYTLI